jgi:hypothetical protein
MSERNIKYFSWFAKSRQAFINCRGVDEHEYYDEWSGKFKTFISRQWTDLKGFPCYNFWDIDSEHPRTAVNYSVRKA